MNIIDTLKSALDAVGRLATRRHTFQRATFREMADICTQSRMIFGALHREGVRDFEREGELARRWAMLAVDIAMFDEALADCCSRISCYFTHPLADPIRDALVLHDLFESLRARSSATVSDKLVQLLTCNSE